MKIAHPHNKILSGNDLLICVLNSNHVKGSVGLNESSLYKCIYPIS